MACLAAGHLAPRHLDHRPLLLGLAALAAFRLLGGRWIHAGERRPFAFYALGTIAIAILCMGPQIRAGSRVILDSAPYGWLMVLPGFDGLRVDALLDHRQSLPGGRGRAWVCEAAATAPGRAPRGSGAVVGCDRGRGLAPRNADRGRPGSVAGGRACRIKPRHPGASARTGVGRGRDVPRRAPPAARHQRCQRLRSAPLWSASDRPHAQDPSVLLALASLGPLDIVVNRAADEDGRWTRYVSGIAGAERTHDDGVRATYRLPDAIDPSRAIGPIWPIAGIHVSGTNAASEAAAIDGDIKTTWTAAPQVEGASLVLHLGVARPSPAPQSRSGSTSVPTRGRSRSMFQTMARHGTRPGRARVWVRRSRGSCARHARVGSCSPSVRPPRATSACA